ncbi:MAG TPA: hydroxymethylpyrimidine/phosphomethylpyrimidine kinase [Polyangia bacterium]
MAPHVLVIAGLDPSGGAGLIADVRTLAEHGVGALGVATALTEQGHGGVRAVNPVDPALVGRQVAALLAGEPVDAVKIGMLGVPATAAAVAAALAAARSVPVVLDPILRASSGAVLLGDDEDAGRAALLALLRRATLVTPNAIEAAALCEQAPPLTLAAAAGLAQALRARGARAVLLKGGHLPAAASPGETVDVLDAGDGPVLLRAPRLAAGAHGTGCALASAIAAHLARGAPLREAVEAARAFLTERLRTAEARGGARYLY